MDISMPPAPKYRIRVGTDYGPVQQKEDLTKQELRSRVDAWMKDERSLTLTIETIYPQDGVL